MIGMSRIQRYVLTTNLTSFLLVLGIFSLAILLVDMVEQMRTIGDNVDIDLGTALSLSVFKLPMLIETTLPFAVLAASMMAFSRLNKRSELPAIRAAGVSAWRFLAPVIWLSLGLGLLATLVLNPVGSMLNTRFETMRSDLLEPAGGPSSPNENVWLRQGDDQSQIVINAREVLPSGAELRNVKLIEEQRIYVRGRPTSDFEFSRRIDAESMRLRDGFWQLENVIENEAGGEPRRYAYLTLPTNLDGATLLDRFANPGTVGFWALPEFMQETREAGLDASRYTMRYHALIAQPVLFVAMALIGAIVCLRLSRLGGTSRLIAIGSLIALGLFFVSQIAQSLGSAGAAPPVVAAWSPALTAFFGALAVIAYREDG